jgi:hypothetical protein
MSEQTIPLTYAEAEQLHANSVEFKTVVSQLPTEFMLEVCELVRDGWWFDGVAGVPNLLYGMLYEAHLTRNLPLAAEKERLAARTKSEQLADSRKVRAKKGDKAAEKPVDAVQEPVEDNG